MAPDDPRHGTYAGANAHWTDDEDLCDPCAAAANTYRKRRKLARHRGIPARVPILGTRRRLQALVFLGYSYADIARALGGTCREDVRKLADDSARTQVSTRTALRVDATFQRLAMAIPQPTNPTERRNVTIARNLARRKGWAGPLAWDDIDNDPRPINTAPLCDVIDLIVVRRILDGDPAPARAATTGERRAVVQAWTTTSRSLSDLARLTGWKPERYAAKTDGAA